jgi:hypothetical protein
MPVVTATGISILLDGSRRAVVLENLSLRRRFLRVESELSSASTGANPAL